MAMQIIDGGKLDRSLTATANKIRQKTGGSAAIPFDYAGETGFAAAIDDIEGGGGSAVLRPLVATENGVFTPPEGVDGFNTVTVNVEIPQHSPRCDVVSTFNWGWLQGYWGWDDVYPAEYPPAPPEPEPDPDPPTPPTPSVFPKWATGTDAEISALLDAAAAGEVDLQRDAGWKVGDTRTIPLAAFTGGGNVTNAAENVQLVITSFDEYEGCGNLLQFDFKVYLISLFRMDEAETNEGGYGQSEMCTVTLRAMVEALPAYLRTRLKTFSVLAAVDGSETAEIGLVTGNKLALRSISEIFGPVKHFAVEGSRIPYYEAAANREKDRGQIGYNRWWTRTPKDEKTFATIGTEGAYAAMANIFLGLAPFGCLGGYVEPEPEPESSFTTGTDAEVAELIDAAQAGTIDLQEDAGWKVGDRRTISVGSFVGGGDVQNASGSFDIVITSFDEYMGCGNVLQFDFVGSILTHFRMSATATNAGGYGASEMYRVTLPAMAQALPLWMRTRLKTFPVIAKAGGQSVTTLETIENNKLALRSYTEVFGVSETYPEDGVPLPYYQTEANRLKKWPGASASSYGWSLRAPVYDTYFYSCSKDGAPVGVSADQRYSVSPFGCL